MDEGKREDEDERGREAETIDGPQRSRGTELSKVQRSRDGGGESKGTAKSGGRADDLTRRVIGAAIEVHRRLGPGFLERIYEGALAIELGLRGIRFRRQVTSHVEYRGVRVGECRLDFLVEEALVLELKAIERLAPVHQAQLISYLRTHGLRLGLLLNFNVPVLKHGIERILNPHFRDL